MPYDTNTYLAEKEKGVRLANGAMPLSRLNGKHYRMINLHMAGLKGGQIAATMGMTQARVSVILNDPLVKAEIDRRFVDADREMIARATKVVDEKMDSNDPAIALRAADMVFRAHGRYEKRVADRPTAEDVVAKMLEVAARTGHASVTVSTGSSPPALDPLLTIDGKVE